MVFYNEFTSIRCNASMLKEDADVYLNRIVVETKRPDLVAQKYNLKIIAKIPIDNDIHEMEFVNRPKVSKFLDADLQTQVNLMRQDASIKVADIQVGKRREVKSYGIEFSDPLWNETWFLNPRKSINDPNGAQNGAMNVMGAWIEGMTGYGIRVAHIDTGIDYNHPDLRYNYDSSISTNIYDPERDAFESSKENNHGTNMAGLVGAAVNNSRCGVGIAYHCRIGMIKVNFSDYWSDATEAKMFSHGRERVDLYINGWGPRKGHLDTVGPLAKQALQEGTIKGRGGKGNIFVLPAGNEGAYGSGCDYNGFANSIFTITINGAGQRGFKPYYGLQCSAVLTTTFTGGSYPSKDIVTTNVGGTCRKDFGGTSASVSIAGGIIALCLQANSNLTWRDVQYLVVLSSMPSPLNSKDANWITNGANKKFSRSFGFGLLNADMLVKQAKEWSLVEKQISCSFTYRNNESNLDENIIGQYLNKRIPVSFNPSSCDIIYLEHVVLTLTASTPKRGDIKIDLLSPMGTNLTVFDGYRGDNSFLGFNNADFLSVGTWGENPTVGNWTVHFQTKRKLKSNSKSFNVTNFRLTIFGTSLRPSNL